MKNVLLIGSLIVSVCANALLLAGFYPVTVAPKPSFVPTIQVSPVAPPIRSAVPLPKPKPVAQVKHHKRIVHKHHKRIVKKAKVYVSPLVKTETPKTYTEFREAHEPPEVIPHKVLKPLKKKPAKVQAKAQPQFTCAQVPKEIVAVPPSLIRSSGFANGYSAVTINKVLACRAKFGGP
jgi:hypothetical protein